MSREASHTVGAREMCALGRDTTRKCQGCRLGQLSTVQAGQKNLSSAQAARGGPQHNVWVPRAEGRRKPPGNFTLEQLGMRSKIDHQLWREHRCTAGVLKRCLGCRTRPFPVPGSCRHGEYKREDAAKQQRLPLSAGHRQGGFRESSRILRPPPRNTNGSRHRLA